MIDPIIEQAIKPFMPSACFKCPTIQGDECRIGCECIHYSAHLVKNEVIRRKRVQADRLKKEYERLMGEIERLSD